MCDRKYGGRRTRARLRNQSKVTGHIRRKAQEMWSLILEKVGPYARVSGSLACLILIRMVMWPTFLCENRSRT